MVPKKNSMIKPKICSLIPSTDFHKAMLLANISQAEGADLVEIQIPFTELPLAPDFLTKIKVDTILVIDPKEMTDQLKKENELQTIHQTYQSSIYPLINFQPYAIELNWKLLSKSLIRESIAKIKNEGIKVILSKYYESFPPEKALLQAIKEMEEFNSDIIKVIGPATHFHDSLMMLSLYHELEPGHLLALCSGEKGKLSQIIAPFLGAEFTYGYLSRKTEVARISLRLLKQNIETLSSSLKDY